LRPTKKERQTEKERERKEEKCRVYYFATDKAVNVTITRYYFEKQKRPRTKTSAEMSVVAVCPPFKYGLYGSIIDATGARCQIEEDTSDLSRPAALLACFSVGASKGRERRAEDPKADFRAEPPFAVDSRRGHASCTEKPGLELAKRAVSRGMHERKEGKEGKEKKKRRKRGKKKRKKRDKEEERFRSL